MSDERRQPAILAVDIGNSIVKGGLFERSTLATSREPAWTGEASLEAPEVLEQIVPESDQQSFQWFVSSVNRPVEERLGDWVRARRRADEYDRLSYRDVPLAIAVDYPAQVGFDRLATSVAAASMKPQDRGVIVVDAGTALKIHAVNQAGAFLGGVILPGFRLAAQSLHRGTDLLPMVDASLNIAPPVVFGRNTQEAIRGGLYWGAVGAVREIVHRMREELGADTPVYVTGGDARGLGSLLDDGVHFVPHLCLLGIARIAAYRLGV